MHLFGLTFVLFLLKLSAGNGFLSLAISAKFWKLDTVILIHAYTLTFLHFGIITLFHN